MWTPKRVLLLAGGFVLFLGAYLVYAFFLGGIDGLPALPVAYLPIEGPVPPGPLPLPEPYSGRPLCLAGQRILIAKE